MAVYENPFIDRLSGPFKPQSVAQFAFLNSPAEMIMYGGAAGSLKSQSLLVDATRYYRSRNYSGLIIRKTLDELRFLINRAMDLYKGGLGAEYNEQQKTFKWPWGAQIKFTYLENDKDVFRLQGNEYQYIGVDESTHHMEFPIRYLINSRMRSIDGIPLRIRLATNPGNVGHDWHMRIFFAEPHVKKTYCVHCQLGMPGQRMPYVIYPDAAWPSDGKSIGYSTQFIPGRVTDHTLFGVNGIDYRKRLAGLPDALAEALMNGCWAAFEGQYFETWDPSKMVVPAGDINPQTWWPYWTSTDWGFGHLAVSYLFTKSPTGKVYILEGHEAKQTKIERITAPAYAVQLKNKWGRYDPSIWYLSHEVFGNKGEDQSIAEQMTMASDIGFTQATRDRVGRAMLMYSMLSNGSLLLSDDPSVEALGSAIQTRVRDDDNRDDVLKVADDGDDRYDAAGYGLTAYVEEPKDTSNDSLEKRASKGRTDPTEIMLAYQILKGKEAQKHDIMFYRHGRLRHGNER